MSVGMPAALHLDAFASHVWEVFGGPPYLVGSAQRLKRGWRDVDVRMIIDDDAWAAWGFEPADSPHAFEFDAKWVALTLAFSSLGRAMTGLPIDFQIQPRRWANERHKGPREALGMVPHRMARLRAEPARDEPTVKESLPVPDGEGKVCTCDAAGCTHDGKGRLVCAGCRLPMGPPPFATLPACVPPPSS